MTTTAILKTAWIRSGAYINESFADYVTRVLSIK